MVFGTYFKEKKYTKLPYEQISEEDVVNLNPEIENYLVYIKGKSSLKNGRHIDREKTVAGLGPCRVEFSFQKNDTNKMLIVVKVEPRNNASEKENEKKYYMIPDGAGITKRINCTISVINPNDIIRYKDMKSNLEMESVSNTKSLVDNKQVNLIVPKITFLFNKTYGKHSEMIDQFTKTYDYCIKVKNGYNSIDQEEKMIMDYIKQAFEIYIKRNPRYSNIY